jgi:hypothetical protein
MGLQTGRDDCVKYGGFLKENDRGVKTITIGDLRALVEQRRSIRGYDEQRQVSDERVHRIVECSRWAPSGGNRQPWEFIVVREQALIFRSGMGCYLSRQLISAIGVQ